MDDQTDRIKRIKGKPQAKTVAALVGKKVKGIDYWQYEENVIEGHLENGLTVNGVPMNWEYDGPEKPLDDAIKKLIKKMRNRNANKEVTQAKAKVRKQVIKATASGQTQAAIDIIKAQVVTLTDDQATDIFETSRDEWVNKLQDIKHFNNPPPVAGTIRTAVFYPNMALMTNQIGNWWKQDRTSTQSGLSAMGRGGPDTGVGDSKGMMFHSAGSALAPDRPNLEMDEQSRRRRRDGRISARQARERGRDERFPTDDELSAEKYAQKITQTRPFNYPSMYLPEDHPQYEEWFRTYATLGYKHSTAGPPIHFPEPKPTFDEDNQIWTFWGDMREDKSDKQAAFDEWDRFRQAWDDYEVRDQRRAHEQYQGQKREFDRKRFTGPSQVGKQYMNWLGKDTYLEELKDQNNWSKYSDPESTFRFPDEIQEDPHHLYTIGHGDHTSAPCGGVRWLNPFYIVIYSKLGLCYIKNGDSLTYFGKLPYKASRGSILIPAYKDEYRRKDFVPDIDGQGLFMENKTKRKSDDRPGAGMVHSSTDRVTGDENWTAKYMYANDILNLEGYSTIGSGANPEEGGFIHVGSGSGPWSVFPTFWDAGLKIADIHTIDKFKRLTKGNGTIGLNNILMRNDPYNVNYGSTEYFTKKSIDEMNISDDGIDVINRVVRTINQFQKLKPLFVQNVDPSLILNGTISSELKSDTGYNIVRDHPLLNKMDLAEAVNPLVVVDGAFYLVEGTDRLNAQGEYEYYIYPTNTNYETPVAKFIPAEVDIIKAQRYPLPFWTNIEALTTKENESENFAFDQMASICKDWALGQKEITDLEMNQVANLDRSQFTDWDWQVIPDYEVYRKTQFSGDKLDDLQVMGREWLNGLTDYDGGEATVRYTSIDHWATTEPIGITVTISGLVYKEMKTEIYHNVHLKPLGIFNNKVKLNELFSSKRSPISYKDITWGRNTERLEMMSLVPTFQVILNDWFNLDEFIKVFGSEDIESVKEKYNIKMGSFMEPHDTHLIQDHSMKGMKRIDEVAYRTRGNVLYDIQDKEKKTPVGKIVGDDKILWKDGPTHYQHLHKIIKNYKGWKIDKIPLSVMTHPHHFIQRGGELVRRLGVESLDQEVYGPRL